MAAGLNATWLRGDDGAVWRWGGEFGAAAYSTSPIPKALEWANPFTQLRQRGLGHVCALVATGDVRCGGSVTELTTGEPIARDIVQIETSLPFDIVHGAQQDCFLNKQGALWCGLTSQDGLPRSPILERTELGSDVVGVGLQRWYQACAIKGEGALWCWGTGSLGDGMPPSDLEGPPLPARRVELPMAVVSVAGTHNATCAALADGSVYCFGHLQGPVDSPIHMVAVKDDVELLSAGWGHFCALTHGGTVWCWGENGSDQTGEAFRGSPWAAPHLVSQLGTDVTSIVAGYFHTCAVHADRTVSCWGDNAFHQLGVNLPSQQSTPEPQTVRGCRSGGDGLPD